MTDSVVKYQHTLAKRTRNDDMHEAANAIWHQLEWQKLLIPGPSSIAILGKLTIVGLVDHIKFAEGKEPYKNLNNLDFRAGVVKLRHEFTAAFSKSYINMDKLRKRCETLLSQTIGLVLEEDMEGMTLKQRNNKITKLLPGFLDEMLESVNKCDIYVKECVTGFQTALETAKDLESASTYTFGLAEEQKQLLELRQVQLAEQIAGATERKVIATKYLEDTKKARDQAETRFGRCLDNIPKGGEMLAIMAGETALELGSQAGSMLIQKHMSLTKAAAVAGTDIAKSGASVGLEKLKGPGGDKTSTSGGGDKSTPLSLPAEEIDFSDPVFRNANDLSAILTTFKSVLTSGSGNSVNWNAVIASDGEISLGYIISTLDDLAEDNDNYGKFQEAQEAKKITTFALQNANKLKGLAKDRDSPDVQSIVSDVKSLSTRAKKLATTISLKSKRPAVSSSLPVATSAPPQAPQTSNKTILQATTENAQFAVVKAEAQVDATRECHAKANESLLQLTKELNDFNNELSEIDPKKIQWEKVRKVLNQAVNHLAELVFNLTQLSEFFAYITSTVTDILKPKVTSFVKRAEIELDDLKDLTFDTYTKKSFAKDCIGIASITFVMHKVGGTYVAIYDSQVSKGMLLLARIPVVPPPGDQSSAMINSGKDLEAWSIDTQDEMKKILQKNLRDFNKELDAQKEKLLALAASLPPPPPEMKEAVESAKIEEVASEAATIGKKRGGFTW